MRRVTSFHFGLLSLIKLTDIVEAWQRTPRNIRAWPECLCFSLVSGFWARCAGPTELRSTYVTPGIKGCTIRTPQFYRSWVTGFQPLCLHKTPDRITPTMRKPPGPDGSLPVPAELAVGWLWGARGAGGCDEHTSKWHHLLSGTLATEIWPMLLLSASARPAPSLDVVFLCPYSLLTLSLNESLYCILHVHLLLCVCVCVYRSLWL